MACSGEASSRRQELVVFRARSIWTAHTSHDLVFCGSDQPTGNAVLVKFDHTAAAAMHRLKRLPSSSVSVTDTVYPQGLSPLQNSGYQRGILPSNFLVISWPRDPAPTTANSLGKNFFF
jgi:hypothetical protein